jgi:gas vesicle protein
MAFRRNPHTGRKVALGSAIAGTIGYLAGVLLAPKTGEQTRNDLKGKASDLKVEAEQQLSDLNEELNQLIKDAKVKTLALSSTARSEFNEAVVRAKDAQNKASQVLKAAKAGQAEDPDLNKAVKQARQAAKNLGKFFKE